MKRLRIPARARRAALFIIPIALGLLVLVILRRQRPSPERLAGEEPLRPVRVVTVQAMPVVPRAVGYGTAVPARVWEAVAEVSGTVVAVDSRLKKGTILAEGTVVFKIDPASYQVQVAQLEASVESLQAQLQELDLREEVDRALLETEQTSLALKEKELQRQNQLLEQEVVSEAEYERTQRDVLAQKLSVQKAEKAVRLLPAQRGMLEANLDQAQAKLEEARIQLQRTEIRTPFECRVADVRVEKGEFASQGQVLAVADGIDVAEVHAQIPAEDLRILIRAAGKGSLLEQAREQRLGERLGITASVHFRSGDFEVMWPARFARISDVVDPRTRTIGVIVEVDKSYARSRPGERPPLMKGMYCEVRLRGEPRPGRLVIPRQALLPGNRVFAVDPEHRLRTRDVQVLWEQDDIAVIGDGVSAGDTLVVSDVVPAVEGMRLQPVPDRDLAQRVEATAGEEGQPRD